MDTTNIRIQASAEFYQALLEEQEKRRNKTGKKTSLGDIIIELCSNQLISTPIDQHSEHYSPRNDQNAGQNDREVLIMAEKRLRLVKTMEDYLASREDIISKREQDLAEREEKLQVEQDKLFDDKSAFLDQKLQNQNKSIDGVIETRISNDMAKKELSAKNEQLITLKEEITYLRDHLEKRLSYLDKKEEPSIMEKLMPFLPSIMSVVGMYLMYRKFDPNNDQDPVQKEINKVFKTLNPDSKDALTKALMEAVGKFGGVGKGDDQKSQAKNDQKK